MAALIGALAPDLSLYLLVGVALVILQIPPRVVFDELYFSSAWQQVFAIDNSFVFWGVGFAIGLSLRLPWLVALTGAALLHLVTDFALHHDDARRHFWPVSDWVFESPLSYWDRRHGAGWVAPLEAALCLVLLVILWRRFTGWRMRGVFCALMGLEAMASVPFLFMAL